MLASTRRPQRPSDPILTGPLRMRWLMLAAHKGLPRPHMPPATRSAKTPTRVGLHPNTTHKHPSATHKQTYAHAWMPSAPETQTKGSTRTRVNARAQTPRAPACSKKYGVQNICFTHHPSHVVYGTRKAVANDHALRYQVWQPARVNAGVCG
eukprot:350242-Chlamydomonas_euryale.AAC.14